MSVPGGLLTRRDGAPCPPVPFSGRWLTEADVPAVIALHHQVRAAVPAEQLCRESDEFFRHHAGPGGRIVGLFAEETLIAYGVLGLPAPQEESFADQFGLSPAERAAAATIDGASVSERWRGNGLQKHLVSLRLVAAQDAGRRIALSTVSPANLPSLANLLAAGLTIRALRSAFGGLRFLVRRDLDAPPPVPPVSGHWIDLADIDAAGAALAAGERGWVLSQAAAAPRIWYAPAEGNRLACAPPAGS